jgi:hypothetical protein
MKEDSKSSPTRNSQKDMSSKHDYVLKTKEYKREASFGRNLSDEKKKDELLKIPALDNLDSIKVSDTDLLMDDDMDDNNLDDHFLNTLDADLELKEESSHQSQKPF